MSSFITLDAAKNTFTIYAKSGEAQTLKVVLVGTLQDNRSFETTFEVQISQQLSFAGVANEPPQFTQPLQDFLPIDLAKSMQQRIVVGSLSDNEDDPFKVRITSKDLNPLKWFSYDEVSREIVVDVDFSGDHDWESKLGFYRVKIAVEANDTTEQVFVLTVWLKYTKDEVENFVHEITLVENEEESIEKPTLVISSINRFGEMKITFSEPLQVPANTAHTRVLRSEDHTLVSDKDISLVLTARDEDMQDLMTFDWFLKEFNSS